MNVETILQERANTHGDFQSKALFIQDVKDAMRQTPNWLNDGLSAAQKEALEAVATKLGRYLFGDATNDDHLADAIGYLRLALGWVPE